MMELQVHFLGRHQRKALQKVEADLRAEQHYVPVPVRSALVTPCSRDVAHEVFVLGADGAIDSHRSIIDCRAGRPRSGARRDATATVTCCGNVYFTTLAGSGNSAIRAVAA